MNSILGPPDLALNCNSDISQYYSRENDTIHINPLHRMIKILSILLGIIFLLGSCSNAGDQKTKLNSNPLFTLQNASFAKAELALWIKEDDEVNSLLIEVGQDGSINGYDIDGQKHTLPKVSGKWTSPSVGYGLELDDDTEIDLLGLIDLSQNKVRLLSIPDLKPMDGEGLKLEGIGAAKLDEIVLYTRNKDDAIFIIVSLQSSTGDNIWHQYQLLPDEESDGLLTANKIRSFGQRNNTKSSQPYVDPVHEYFYYLDASSGVRKYFANPDLGSEEQGILQTGDNVFHALSAYEMESYGGYIIVAADEQLHFFSRGTIRKPNDQPLLHSMDFNSTNQLLVTSTSLNQNSLAKGSLISKSNDVVDWYDWREIALEDLVLAPNGIPDPSDQAVKPKYVTEPTAFDTDDPAIWIHPEDPAGSLIIGTDKEDGGGIYIYDLQGKIIKEKVITGLHRPNNVDLEYGLEISGKPTDIIVVSERNNEDVRVFSFPDLEPLDHGGIPVFEGEAERDPMGISLYKRPEDQAIFAIVGRKSGPSEGYLWQYRITDDGRGGVAFKKVRSFGRYSGKKEIEAIAVDDALGYVYCSDEGVGIRKYYADPAKGNEELALFGQWDFGQDHEGISIFNLDGHTGYILVSDQQRNRFNVYPREGSSTDPNQHDLITSVEVSTVESDGSEVTSLPINSDFPNGLFVAMSTDKTFHLYDWNDIAGDKLKSRK